MLTRQNYRTLTSLDCLMTSHTQWGDVILASLASTLSPCHRTNSLGDPHRDCYRQFTMYDVPYLCERFGLTTKQVRDRITALSPTLTTEIRQGKRGAKLLTDAGIAIFDRLIELERGGLAVTTAVEQVLKERSEATPSPLSTSVSGQGVSSDPAVLELLIKQNEDLRHERDRLITLLEDQSAQLRAVLPRTGEVSTDQRRTRWQNLKAVFTGG